MIEINLLPIELRKRKTLKKITIPKEFIVVLGVILLAALLLFHALLQVFVIVNNMAYNQLNKKWISIQPQKKQIDSLKGQIKKLKDSETAFSQVVGQGLEASQKLNIISDSLANGVWLNDILMSGDILEIDGGCVSSSHQELVQVGKFLSALKNGKRIREDFPKLELVSVFRNKIGRVEMVDFMISSRDTRASSKK